MSQEHRWRPWVPAGAEEPTGGEGSMEIFIETLMGPAFEITVSPNDTIGFIKQKIQRVEGIPVSQQNIVYNLCELADSSTLAEHNIREGATLKLVLSMRGGPISTRRLPQVDDYSIRELREFVENNKENMMEQLPPGCRVTVLVIREGDSVSLFKVIENDDGTYSPISDTWSGSSIRNIFSDSDCEEVAERLQENSTTMGKMHALKQQMEKLSLKKSKKCKKKDEEDAGASSESTLEDDSKMDRRDRDESHLRNNAQLPPIAAPQLPDPNNASYKLSGMPKKYLIRKPRELKSLPPEYYGTLRIPSSLESVPYDDIISHKLLPNKLDPIDRELTLNHKSFGTIGSEMASQPKNFGHIGSEMMARKKRDQELANNNFKPFPVDQRSNMYLDANFERYEPGYWPRKDAIDKDLPLPDLHRKSFDSFPETNAYRSHRHSPKLANHENATMDRASPGIAIVEEENPLDSNFPQSPIAVASTVSSTIAISQRSLPRERLSKSTATSKNRYRLRRYGLVFADHERPKTSPDLKICQKSYCDLMSENTTSYEESDTDSKYDYEDVLAKSKGFEAEQESLAGKHIIENPKFENGFVDSKVYMKNVSDLLTQRMSESSKYEYDLEKDLPTFATTDKTRLFHQSLYNRITTGRNYIAQKLGESNFENADTGFPDNIENRLPSASNESNVHFLGRVKSPVLSTKDIFEANYENKDSLFGLGADGGRIGEASGYDSGESSYLQLETAELQTVSRAEPQLQVLGRVRSPILSTKDIFHVDKQESDVFKPSTANRLEELGIEQKIKILGRVQSPVLATDNFNFEKEHALYDSSSCSDAAPFEKQIKILGRVTSPVISADEYSYEKEDILYRPNFPVTDANLDKHIQILGRVQKSPPKDKKNVQTIISNPPKKTTVKTRCFHCHKRLNITNIYNCRCGNLFCSAHRYSEVHGCNYDYKTAGRKFLEQNNPLVTAPKLPKI